MTTEQYLLELIQAKNDMKEALREKGVEVWGGLNTYPDAIRELSPMGTVTVYDGTKFKFSTWVNPPLLDTSNITDMSGMFLACYNLKSIPQLNTSNVTNMSGAFEECNSISTIPILDTSNVDDMSRMFYGCGRLVHIPQLNTSSVTNMSEMFCMCDYLTTSPQLDTSNVVDMSRMFYGCEDLDRFYELNTSKVTDMNSMFFGCSSLTSIHGLDISKVTDMFCMFWGCSDLRVVEFIGKVSSGVKTSYMFDGCKNLKMYYPNRFADSYKVIIQELPSSCVAIGYDE